MRRRCKRGSALSGSCARNDTSSSMPPPLLQGTRTESCLSRRLPKKDSAAQPSALSSARWRVCLLVRLRRRSELPPAPLIGGSADLTNEGVDTEFAEKISRELAPGKAAVVAEVDNEGVVAFEALMKSIGGTVVRK